MTPAPPPRRWWLHSLCPHDLKKKTFNQHLPCGGFNTTNNFSGQLIFENKSLKKIYIFLVKTRPPPPMYAHSTPRNHDLIKLESALPVKVSTTQVQPLLSIDFLKEYCKNIFLHIFPFVKIRPPPLQKKKKNCGPTYLRGS